MVQARFMVVLPNCEPLLKTGVSRGGDGSGVEKITVDDAPIAIVKHTVLNVAMIDAIGEVAWVAICGDEMDLIAIGSIRT